MFDSKQHQRFDALLYRLLALAAAMLLCSLGLPSMCMKWGGVRCFEPPVARGQRRAGSTVPAWLALLSLARLLPTRASSLAVLHYASVAGSRFHIKGAGWMRQLHVHIDSKQSQVDRGKAQQLQLLQQVGAEHSSVQLHTGNT